ncbi:GGDEF domain [Shewanella denitrificans OS217]|uniref:diguanylate cyclase n=1 Tax=Shewanella denitrificans (strain OS217 / ATCC BAA-1090 / DSM 15013) TaxID=318161 RepID=Q12NN0_SHEDO|nr:diguanylate cyclase [Shewanella denitrificans]ABE54946.1 GGDEF domain [Shewanella denitrificans OS217]
MNLRKFFLIYAMSLLGLLLAFFLAYRALVVIPKMDKQQLIWQQREVGLVQQAFISEFSQLKTINYDYSVWDESYHFLETFNQGFIDSNFLPDTYTSLKIDASYFFDPKGQLIWGKAMNWQTQAELDFPQVIIGAPKIAAKLMDNNTAEGSVSGVLKSVEGVVLFSVTRVRKSDKSGDNIGFMMFLRILRPEALARLSALTGMKIEHQLFLETTLAAEDLLNLQALTELKTERKYFLGDVDNSPVLLLTLGHSEDATEFARVFFFDMASLITVLALLIFPLSLLLLVNHFLVKPIEFHTRETRRMLSNEELYCIKSSCKINELHDLQNGFNQLVETINRQQKILSIQASEDVLTKVANRRAFEQFYDVSWRAMLRQKTPLALLLCDIDHFKSYNDHYGHAAGDKVITAVAGALKTRFGRATDLVARYGGEEFAIVLTHISLDECELNAQAAIQQINALDIAHGFSPVSEKVTISIGMTIIDPNQTDLDDIDPLSLFLQTDRALYKAKKLGRNRYLVREFEAESLSPQDEFLARM